MFPDFPQWKTNGLLSIIHILQSFHLSRRCRRFGLALISCGLVWKLPRCSVVIIFAWSFWDIYWRTDTDSSAASRSAWGPSWGRTRPPWPRSIRSSSGRSWTKPEGGKMGLLDFQYNNGGLKFWIYLIVERFRPDELHWFEVRVERVHYGQRNIEDVFCK